MIVISRMEAAARYVCSFFEPMNVNVKMGTFWTQIYITVQVSGKHISWLTSVLYKQPHAHFL